MNANMLCPCGSGVTYDDCCKSYHDGIAIPKTAEALMRSRFSAYMINKMEYILESWDTSTRPALAKLNFGDETIEWQKLEILECKKGGINDSKGTVEFKAYFLQQGEEQVLHEASRFSKTNDRWFYVDGVVKKIGKIILQNNQGKNSPCPCGSGKKFKRCCGSA